MTRSRVWKPYSSDDELVDLYRQDRELLERRAELIDMVKELDDLVPDEAIYGAFQSVDRQRSKIWDQIRRRKSYLKNEGRLLE